MATCVISKQQSRKCLMAARCILLKLPQTEKLTDSDEAVVKAILNAVSSGQLEEWEVTGVAPWIQPLNIEMPGPADYGVVVPTDKPKSKSFDIDLSVICYIALVLLIAAILIAMFSI